MGEKEGGEERRRKKDISVKDSFLSNLWRVLNQTYGQNDWQGRSTTASLPTESIETSAETTHVVDNPLEATHITSLPPPPSSTERVVLSTLAAGGGGGERGGGGGAVAAPIATTTTTTTTTTTSSSSSPFSSSSVSTTCNDHLSSESLTDSPTLNFFPSSGIHLFQFFNPNNTSHNCTATSTNRTTSTTTVSSKYMGLQTAATCLSLWWLVRTVRALQKAAELRYADIPYQIRRPDALSSRITAFKYLVVGGLVIPVAAVGAAVAFFRPLQQTRCSSCRSRSLQQQQQLQPQQQQQLQQQQQQLQPQQQEQEEVDTSQQQSLRGGEESSFMRQRIYSFTQELRGIVETCLPSPTACRRWAAAARKSQSALIRSPSSAASLSGIGGFDRREGGTPAEGQ